MATAPAGGVDLGPVIVRAPSYSNHSLNVLKGCFHVIAGEQTNNFHFIISLWGGGQGGPEIHEHIEIIFDSDESCSVLSPSTGQRSG